MVPGSGPMRAKITQSNTEESLKISFFEVLDVLF
jgi:hypothetical protein